MVTVRISAMAGIYFVMYVAALILVALPVIYFGQIDATSAMLLAGGLGLLIWATVRILSMRK